MPNFGPDLSNWQCGQNRLITFPSAFAYTVKNEQVLTARTLSPLSGMFTLGIFPEFFLFGDPGMRHYMKL